MDTICGIYEIRNLVNNKKYVGSSRSTRQRWANHKKSLEKNKHHNQHLQAAWNKYGKDSFIFKVVERFDKSIIKEELLTRETFWIEKFNTANQDFGYNITLPLESDARFSNRNSTKRKIPLQQVYWFTQDQEPKLLTVQEAEEITGINDTRIYKVMTYWKNVFELEPTEWKAKGKYSKHSHGNIFVKQEHYNPEFDYFNYEKQSCRVLKEKLPKTYTPPQYKPLRLTNIHTGEVLHFQSKKALSRDETLKMNLPCINRAIKKNWTHYKGYKIELV